MLSHFIKFLLLGILSTSCATILNSGTQEVHLQPSNSKLNPLVRIESNNHNSTTRLPYTLNVKSSHQNIKVTVVDPEYEEASVSSNKSITTSFYMNVLLLPFGGIGLLGFLIDVLTGNLYDYDDNLYVSSNLKKEIIAMRKNSDQMKGKSFEQQTDDSEILDLNFDSSHGEGTITLKGQKVKNRSALLETIGGICSTAHVKIKAGSQKLHGGYYKISTESVKNGSYQISFRCLY